MIWQDIAITIIIIAFSYALIPQIYKGFKKKKSLINLQTSFITGLGMYLLSFIYFTMDLYFSTIISFITGIFWTILFIQGINYK